MIQSLIHPKRLIVCNPDLHHLTQRPKDYKIQKKENNEAVARIPNKTRAVLIKQGLCSITLPESEFKIFGRAELVE